MFWYLNCLICFTSYLFISFIYLVFWLHNFLGTLDLFPSLQLKKNLRSAPVLYATILVHLRQRLKCTVVITHCPSSVRRRELFTLSTSPLNGTQRKMTGIKISSSSTKLLAFSGLIRKTRWPPWPIRQKGGTLYSGARFMALWAPYFILDLFIMFHIVHIIMEIAYI